MSALRHARGANLDLFQIADRLQFDDPLRLDTVDLPHARAYEVVLPDTRGRAHHAGEPGAEAGGWVARVERMDGRRIDRVRLVPVDAAHLPAREHNHG